MGNGVEKREKSIRLFFVTADGAEHRETLRVNGKPMAPTPANLKFAERTALAIRQKIDAGNFVLAEYFPDSPRATVGHGNTLATQLDDWIAAQRIAPSTRAGYVSAARFWKTVEVDGLALGQVGLRSLRHSHFLKAIATKDGLSGKTINNYVSVLREALQMAVLDKSLTENPANSVPAALWQKPPIDPFSEAEVALILAEAERSVPVCTFNLIKAWMYTGMRTSEILGLRWENVNLAGQSALVSEALVNGIEKDNTKTGVARTVRLSSPALAALKAQHELTGAAGHYVFHVPGTDQPWLDSRLFQRGCWVSLLARAGVRYRRPYNMRHTQATRMLMAGMTPAFCAKQLGHSVEMFLGTYSKWITGDADAGEMALLERSISTHQAGHESKTSPALPQEQGA